MVKKGHYDGWLKDDKLNEEIKSEFKSGGSILISGTKEAFQKFVQEGIVKDFGLVTSDEQKAMKSDGRLIVELSE